MPRKSASAVALAAAPTETAVLAATPRPQTIQAPDAMAFFRQYQTAIAPLEQFQVTDNDSFMRAGAVYQQVCAYIDAVTAAFEAPASLAFQTHRSITSLRGMFVDPAELVKANLANQQLAWKRQLDAAREAEQRRLQREAQEAAEQQRAREAEQIRQQQQLALLAAQTEKMPWEEDPEDAAPVAVVVAAPEPIHVPELRLPSTVPFVPGISTRKRPWAGRVVDFKKLVIEAGARAALGDDSMLQLLMPNTVRLNQLARDHEKALGEIFGDSVEAFQDEGLARS